MSIRNRVVGLLKYKRHVETKLLKDCYSQVGSSLQAACPDVTFLEYVIGAVIKKWSLDFEKKTYQQAFFLCARGKYNRLCLITLIWAGS